MPLAMDVQPHAAALATIACMDFDRLTITLLELRVEAPGLTPEQEDALQDAHMAYLAGLHQSGHLLAAGPLLDRDSPFRGLSILSVGVEEARALKERDPAVQAGKYRVIALPWMVPSRGNDLFPHHLSAVCVRGCRNLTTTPASGRSEAHCGKMSALTGPDRHG